MKLESTLLAYVSSLFGRVLSRAPTLADGREQEILARYQALSKEHFNLNSDYLSERDNRRNYQKTLEEKMAQVADYERQLVRCPGAKSASPRRVLTEKIGCKFVRLGPY
jgi:hypothetical protein